MSSIYEFLSVPSIWKTIKTDVEVPNDQESILFGAQGVIQSSWNKKLRVAGFHMIDHMDGKQFEYCLAELFKFQGYIVATTAASNDYGADLILKKDVRKIVVQAKQYKKNPGIGDVQQAIGAKAHYNANEAWAITNRFFTAQARNLADSAGVRLIERNKFQKRVVKMNPTAASSQYNLAQIPKEDILCAACSKPMVIRNSAKGSYYGCSAFPKCKTTKPITA